MANTTPNKELVPQPEIDKVLRFDEAIKLLRGDLVSLLPDAQAASKALSGVVGYKELQQGVAQVEELKKRVQSLETELTKLKNSQKQAVQEIMKADSEQVKSAKQVSAEIAKQGKATDELAAKVDNYRQKLAQLHKEAQNKDSLTFTDSGGNADLSRSQEVYASQMERTNQLQKEATQLMEEGALSAGQYANEIESITRAQQRIEENYEIAKGANIRNEYVEDREALEGVSEATEQVSQAQERQIDTLAKLNEEIKNEKTEANNLRVILDKVLGSREENIALLNKYQTELAAVKAAMKQLTKDEQEGKISGQDLAKAKEVLIKRDLELKEGISDVTQVIRAQYKEYATYEGSMANLAKRLEVLRIAARKFPESMHGSAEYKMIIGEITELDATVKAFDATIGNHQRNVGGYTEGILSANKALSLIDYRAGAVMTKIRTMPAIKKAWSKATEVLTKNLKMSVAAAQALQFAGVGLGVALGVLAVKGIKNYITKLKEARAEAEENFNLLNTVSAQGKANANADISRLEILYKATQDTSKGMKERVDATKALQKEYPSYLGNMSQEEILAGQAAGAYDRLKNSIIASATAKAYADKIAENSAEILKFEEENAKALAKIEENNIKMTAAAALEFDGYSQAQLGFYNANRTIFEKENKKLSKEIDERNKSIEKIVKTNKTLYDNIDFSALAETDFKKVTDAMKDMEKALEKLKKDEAKAVRDYALLLIQNDADTQKTIAENDKKSYGDRINALNSYLEIQTQSIKKDAENQIQAKIEELKALGMTEEQAREALQNQIILINAKAQAELTKLTEAGEKTRESITKDYADKQIKDISDRATEAARAIEKKESASLMALAKLYSEGNILHEEYQAEKTRIARQAAQERLDAEIGFLEEQLTATDLTEEQLTEIRKKIADAGLKYSTEVEKQITEDYYENAKKREEIEKQLAQTRKQILQEVFNFASALSDRWTQQELDRLEKESEEHDKWADEQKDRIDRLEQSGAISKEHAQARKDVIDQQAKEKEKETEQKRVEAQKKQAKFQKSLSALQIIISTAQAVMAAFAQAGPIAGIPLAAAMTALGAIQLATVLAEPIPEYAKGTKDHPGGPAVIGDGGRPEMVVTPGGSVLRTPSKPTIWDMPAGTMVLPDYEKAIAALAFTALPGMNDKDTGRVISFGELVQGNKEMVKSINRFMSSYERGKGENRHNYVVNNISKSRKWS